MFLRDGQFFSRSHFCGRSEKPRASPVFSRWPAAGAFDTIEPGARRPPALRGTRVRAPFDMYIPFWLFFIVVMWTWLGVEFCRNEASVANVERRMPEYRWCWGAASIVIGAFVAACAAIFVFAPLAVRVVGGLVDVARRMV